MKNSNRILALIAGGAGACAIAVPMVLGLSGNSSFSERIPVRVPSAAHLVDFDDKGHPLEHRSTTPSFRPSETEPGDDHGGRRSHTEPGDDHGGLTTHTEPGDDHGGRTSATAPRTTSGTTSTTDDHGGRSGSDDGSDDGSGGGSGRHGSDDHSGSGGHH